MEENETQETVKIEKIGFFKKVWYSITKLEKYPDMTILGLGSSIKYFLKLMLLFSLILTIGLMIKTYFVASDAISYFENSFPNVSYKEGILTIDQQDVIKYEKEGVIVDTTSDSNEAIKKYENEKIEDATLLILKDQILVKNPAMGSATTYKYDQVLKDLQIEKTEISKQDIIDFARGKAAISIYSAIFIVMFLSTFTAYILSTVLDTLLLAVFGYLTAILAKIKMKFVAIYNMSVYALTLSIILNLIYVTTNIFVTFDIKYFQVMYTSVAFIYLAAAIFMIKSDFIKKQMELMKIIEEQKIVKKELEENKEDQKEEKPEETDSKEDEKKEEEPEQEDGKEPESSEAFKKEV